MNCYGWSRGDSGEEHEHQSDAVLESVMVFRLAAGAVAEVVVPLGLAKVGFLSGCTGVLGIVAAAEEYVRYHLTARVSAQENHSSPRWCSKLGKSVPLSTGPSKSQVCYSVIGYRLHGAAFGPAKLLCSFRFIISL